MNTETKKILTHFAEFAVVTVMFMLYGIKIFSCIEGINMTGQQFAVATFSIILVIVGFIFAVASIFVIPISTPKVITEEWSREEIDKLYNEMMQKQK